MEVIVKNVNAKTVWVAGHRGMVGSAIHRQLVEKHYNVITAGRGELDLIDQTSVREWVAEKKPDAVVLAAAKVGGILANDTYPADFLYNNLMIESNAIEASHRADVNRLVFLGS